MESRKGLYEIRLSAVLAGGVDSGELDDVTILCLPRVQKPRGEEEEKEDPHIEHARRLRSYLNHEPSSKKGLIES